MSTEALERGRRSFERHEWADAYAQLSAADHDAPLDLDDLERLGVATHMLGRDEATREIATRAHREALSRGEVARAVRHAFWLCLELAQRGEMAQSSGWLARAQRLLEGHPDCVERGYVLLPAALQNLEQHEFDVARAAFDEVARIADQFGDSDLATLARLGSGEALIGLAKTKQGVALLDEAMVAVTAGELSPAVVGIVYCSVIETCWRIFDVRRAQEWTTALSRWCDSQPDLVPYRGQCLLYRAELMAMHGAWQDAINEADRAHGLLAGPVAEPAAGAAYYQQAEVHRLRGEFASADAAYQQASRYGRPPQPGLALLRFAEGRVDAAATAISRSLDETDDALARPRLLDASAEIAIAAGDLAAARAAAEELLEIATTVGAPILIGMASRAAGALRLAEGDARAAMTDLRLALEAWRGVEAPYEAARVRVLIGLACRTLGDDEGARMEFHAACETFLRLGAGPDLARTRKLDGGTMARQPGGLTDRELEVLRLVAAGKTNRSIAADLVISEKTVARHLSNIFTKLRLSSRSAATAYAYEHDLLSAPA